MRSSTAVSLRKVSDSLIWISSNGISQYYSPGVASYGPPNFKKLQIFEMEYLFIVIIFQKTDFTTELNKV